MKTTFASAPCCAGTRAAGWYPRLAEGDKNSLGGFIVKAYLCGVFRQCSLNADK